MFCLLVIYDVYFEIDSDNSMETFYGKLPDTAKIQKTTHPYQSILFNRKFGGISY